MKARPAQEDTKEKNRTGKDQEEKSNETPERKKKRREVKELKQQICIVVGKQKQSKRIQRS